MEYLLLHYCHGHFFLHKIHIIAIVRMKHFLVSNTAKRHLNAQKQFIFILERIRNPVRIRISQSMMEAICQNQVFNGNI